jgi:predicted dehydrogenase
VDICTPTFTHKEIAVQCANKGWHVLVEKPITYTLEDARAMLEAARLKNRYLMVAQVLRFWPEYILLKQAYDEGRYGKPIQFHFSRICGAPAAEWEGWSQAANGSSPAAFDLHIHDLDFIYYLLGKPSAVCSSGVNKPGIRASYLNTRYLYQDLPEVIIQAEGGWWQGRIPFSASFRAVFEKATLVYEHEELVLYQGGEPEPQRITPAGKAPREADTDMLLTNAIRNEIAYFVECVRTQAAPAVITPEETCATLEILKAELKSAESGKKVFL